MKSKTCKVCIVQAICNSGCDRLWNEYFIIKKRFHKLERIDKISKFTIPIFVFIWPCLVLFGLIDVGDGKYFINIFNVSFNHWWYTGICIGHMIVVVIADIMRRYYGKIIKGIEAHDRGTYLIEKMCTDVFF